MAIEIVDFPMKNGWSFHSYFDITRGYIHHGFLGLFFGNCKKGHHGRRGGTWPKDAGNEWGITVSSNCIHSFNHVLSCFYPSFRTAMMGLPKSRGNKRWFWENAEYSSSFICSDTATSDPKWSKVTPIPLLTPRYGSRWPNEYVRKTAPFHLVVFNNTLQ